MLLADEQIDEQHLGLPTASHVSAESLNEVVAALEVGVSLKQIVSRSTSVVERTALINALRRSAGNKAKAARMLRVDYKTMHNKLKVYGLNRKSGGDR